MISGVISRATIVIIHVRGRVTLLMTTHEPPSRECWIERSIGVRRVTSSSILIDTQPHLEYATRPLI